MKLIGTLLFILTFCIRADAAQFSLVKMDAITFESHAHAIREAIANDHAEPEQVPFYKDQSFLLKGEKGQRIGYFIPASFNSKSYGKSICRLYFFDLNNQFKYADLFAHQNDGDEVVPNCVAVEAVSIQAVAADEVNYLVILLHAFFNNYGHIGVVVNYKNGNIRYDKKLNDCIDTKGETRSIVSLKKKILSCKNKPQNKR